MSSRMSPRTLRVLSSLAAVALAAAGAATTSAPAHAANLGTIVYNGSSLEIEADLLDIFTIQNLSGASVQIVNVTAGAISHQGGSPVCNGAGGDCTISNNSLYTFRVNALGTANIVGATTRTLTITGPSSGGGDTPPPVVQQFGKPASGTCDAAAPVTLNWGGAGSGGWGESWAQWMNSGNGGAVCTRTLVYSNNLGSWTVG